MKEYLEKSNPQLKSSEVEVIMKCLSSNINARYSSCDELMPVVKAAEKLQI